MILILFLLRQPLSIFHSDPIASHRQEQQSSTFTISLVDKHSRIGALPHRVKNRSWLMPSSELDAVVMQDHHHQPITDDGDSDRHGKAKVKIDTLRQQQRQRNKQRQ